MSSDIIDLPPPPADLRLEYGSDQLHFGDLRLPAGPGPHPVAVVIHGGFWRARYDLEHIGHLCAALTARGIVTWNVEYRRVGDPGGGWPGTLLDVARATDYLREIAPECALDLGRLVAIGHSAGGHLALWLAGRHRLSPGDPLYTPDPLPLRAALSLAGVADLRRGWELGLSRGAVEEFLGGAPDSCPERYASASPIELLPLGVPQWLLHGSEDDTVPIEIGQRYHDRALVYGDDLTFLSLAGTGHYELIDPRSEVWPWVEGAVLQALASGA